MGVASMAKTVSVGKERGCTGCLLRCCALERSASRSRLKSARGMFPFLVQCGRLLAAGSFRRFASGRRTRRGSHSGPYLPQLALTKPPSTGQESALSYADKTLTCRDCGRGFAFTRGEQEFYATRGFTNEPGRCPDCR